MSMSAEARLKERKMKLESLAEENQALKEKRTKIIVLMAERVKYRVALDKKNEEINELKVKAKEVSDLVKTVNDPKNLSPKSQELLMNDLLSPLLKAISALQIFTGQSLITDEKFETILKLKVD